MKDQKFFERIKKEAEEYLKDVSVKGTVEDGRYVVLEYTPTFFTPSGYYEFHTISVPVKEPRRRIAVIRVKDNGSLELPDYRKLNWYLMIHPDDALEIFGHMDTIWEL